MKNIHPFEEIYTYIARYPYSGSSIAFAKLILSLSHDAPYSLSECLVPLDKNNIELAKKAVLDVFQNGRSKELCEVGNKIAFILPELLRVYRKKN